MGVFAGGLSTTAERGGTGRSVGTAQRSQDEDDRYRAECRGTLPAKLRCSEVLWDGGGSFSKFWKAFVNQESFLTFIEPLLSLNLLTEIKSELYFWDIHLEGFLWSYYLTFFRTTKILEDGKITIKLKIKEEKWKFEHFINWFFQILMQRADEKEKKKADAKNSVEEYVYDMRDKLSDHYQVN